MKSLNSTASITAPFAGLDVDQQAALRNDLEQLGSEHNQSNNGVARYAYEYLEVVATQA